MVATCLVGASCYYRAPSDNVALFFLIVDSRIDAQPALGVDRFCQAFNELMWIPGDMKKRIVSYFVKNRQIDERALLGNQLTCSLADGKQIEFAFEKKSNGGMMVSYTCDRTALD